MTYETRYCAFVDILGFQSMLRTTEAENIRQILMSVRNLPLAEGRDRLPFSQSDLKFQSFSDNICVSAANNADGLAHIMHSLEALAIALLDGGTLLRGGIVRGNLFHDEHVVFGDALVAAYNLESTIANHPRIMITREVVADARRLFPSRFTDDFIEGFIQQSGDGPFFLNVLYGMRPYLESTDAPVRESWIQRYQLMAARLQERFDASVDNPRHYAKLLWFARYWNEATGAFRADIPAVTGPGTNTFD
ncbi:MAG: hypothetical protein AAB403_17115 [Planctomycetota bacterium]